MKKTPFLFFTIMIVLCIIGCKEQKTKPILEKNKITADSLNAGDSTVYGTMIEGGMNSLLLVTDAGDTIEYIENPDDTTEVVRGGKICGDKFAVIGYRQYGDLFLRSAINLTSLLGNWTSLDRDFDIKEGGTIVSNMESERNPWTSWKIFNGRLVLSKDTFDVLELGPNSMSLENNEGIFVFSRKK